MNATRMDADPHIHVDSRYLAYQTAKNKGKQEIGTSIARRQTMDLRDSFDHVDT